jgi:hypothetical protein
VNVEEHILEILATTSGRPLTIGDLAGRLGISPTIVVPAARRPWAVRRGSNPCKVGMPCTWLKDGLVRP